MSSLAGALPTWRCLDDALRGPAHANACFTCALQRNASRTRGTVDVHGRGLMDAAHANPSLATACTQPLRLHLRSIKPMRSLSLLRSCKGGQLLPWPRL